MEFEIAKTKITMTKKEAENMARFLWFAFGGDDAEPLESISDARNNLWLAVDIGKSEGKNYNITIKEG